MGALKAFFGVIATIAITAITLLVTFIIIRWAWLSAGLVLGLIGLVR